MTKRPITKPAGKKPYGAVFGVTNSQGRILENEEGKAVFETTFRTFRATKIKGRFILYELDRKKRPRRIMTRKARKKELLPAFIQRIQNGQIFLKSKERDYIRREDGSKLEIEESNYFAQATYIEKGGEHTRGRISPQMVALVRVTDERRNITDYFVGYSKKLGSPFYNKSFIEVAEDECVSMAIGKFITVYGAALKSGDIVAEIVERRYRYYKK
jgi:Fe-S oxidoreductase